MGNRVKCPHCGSTNVRKTIKGTLTGGAISVGGSVIGGAINNILGFHTPAGSVAKSFMRGMVPQEYECKSCDCLLKVTFDLGNEVDNIAVKKLPVPEAIIQKEKDTYVENLKANTSGNCLASILMSIPTIGLFIYCWKTDFKYEVWKEANLFTEAGYYPAYHWSWLFWAFLFVCSLIASGVVIGSYINSINKLSEVKNQPLKEFKHSHPELFEKYPQYN